MNKWIKNNFSRNNILFSAAVWCIFAVFVFLFPYTGDDWAWGSEIGIARLRSLFDNYNGRYAGNLLVMALTRSKLLNIAVTATTLLIVCWIPKLYIGSKKFLPLILALALTLFMPSKTWVQAVAWTAGFSNYIPPIVLICLYLVIVRNVFEPDLPKYHKSISLLTGAIGFVSSLFMENVTLYGLLTSFCVVLYVWIKHKKLFSAHIGNLLGCIAGTIVMFSNTAYVTISENADGYRATAINEGILETVTSNISTICQQFLIDNIAILSVLTAICLVLAYFSLRKDKTKKNNVVKMALIINVFCFGIILARKHYNYWLVDIDMKAASVMSDMILFLIALLYFASVLVITLTCVTDKTRMQQTIWALVSVAILIAPLAVVNPIGPRCFSHRI